jgi:hypothetical protein
MFLFSVLLFCALPILILLNAIVLPCALTKLADRIWPERSGEDFSVLPIRLAFDPDQALLWDTQIPMLQLVAQSEPNGTSVARLRKAYRESVGHYPEIYEGFTFEQWLRSLDEAQLVTCIRRRVRRRVRVTRKGAEFLQYRHTAHPTDPTPLLPAEATHCDMAGYPYSSAVDPTSGHVRPLC